MMDRNNKLDYKWFLTGFCICLNLNIFSQVDLENRNKFKVNFQVFIESQEYNLQATFLTFPITIYKTTGNSPSSILLNVQKIKVISSNFCINYGFGLREIKQTFWYTWALSSSDEWRDFIKEKSYGSFFDMPIDLSSDFKISNFLFVSPRIGSSFSLLMFKNNNLEFKNDNYKFLVDPPGSNLKSFVIKPYFDFGLGVRFNNSQSLLASFSVSNKTKYYKGEEMLDKYYLQLIFGFKLTYVIN